MDKLTPQQLEAIDKAAEQVAALVIALIDQDHLEHGNDTSK